MNNIRLLRPIGFAAFLCLGVTNVAVAGQPAPATLTGTVTDPSGAAVQDASVVASEVHHPEWRLTAQTDRSGAYVFRGLRAGTYGLTVDAPPFVPTATTAVVVADGQQAIFDVRLALDRFSERVSVHANPIPLLDVASAATTTVLDQRTIEALPVSRNVSGLVNLAPAVHDDVAVGGTEHAVAAMLDGSPGSEPGWGAAFVNPNVNWIEQVTTVTSGAPVSQVDSSGARVEYRLRSGGEQLTGLAEYWSVLDWVGDNRAALPEALRQSFRPLEILERSGLNGQAGGPVVRNRLWFFSGAERLHDDTRTAAFNNAPRTRDEPFRSSTEWRGIAKLTGVGTERIRAEAFYSYDSGTGRGLNAAPFVRPEAYISARTLERAWGAGATWAASGDTSARAHYGGHAVVTTNEPTPPSALTAPMPHIDRATGVRSANAPFFNRMTSKPQLLSVAVDHYVRHGGGHQLQAGFDTAVERLTTENGYPGGGIYTDLNGVPVQLELWDGSRYAPRQTRTSVYVQDTWRPRPRVTLAGGVRATANRGRVPVKGTVFSTSPVAPRLSVAWDATARHTTVARAYIGRQHEPLYTTDYDFLDPSRESPDRFYSVGADGALGLIDEFLPSSRSGIARAIRQPRVDEVSLAIDHAAGRGVTIRAGFIYRAYRDFIVTIDTGSTYGIETRADPGLDGITNTADDGPPLPVFNAVDPTTRFLTLTNTSDAFRNYRAFQLVATRPAATGLALQASYTWSSDRGSVGNGAGNRAGRSDTGWAGLFTDPNGALNRIGPTAFDAPHEAKALATLTSDRLLPGLAVSTVAHVQSGRPWERQVAARGLRQGFLLLRAEPRGSRRTAVMSAVDLRVAVPVGGCHTAVYVDVYNVLNSGYAVGVQQVAGPSVGNPLSWSAPRTATIGVRATF